MKIYGYIRVSSKDQNPDRQYEAMINNGVEKDNIFVDKISGKSFERPQYKKMMKKLKPGDEVVILSIDRLGRNYDEILEQWRIITKEKVAHIAVVDMPLLNTRSEKIGLTGIFIADLILQVLAYVAETERAFIRQRQAEGIAVAKKNGVKFGAERKELGAELEEYCYLWINGKITLNEGAEKFGVSQSTFYRRCLEVRKKKNLNNSELKK